MRRARHGRTTVAMRRHRRALPRSIGGAIPSRELSGRPGAARPTWRSSRARSLPAAAPTKARHTPPILLRASLLETPVRLRRELSMLRQWSRRIAAAGILAGVTALALSLTTPSTYDATATLVVGRSLSESAPSYGELLAWEEWPQTYAL